MSVSSTGPGTARTSPPPTSGTSKTASLSNTSCTFSEATRAIAGTSRPEFLLVSTETDEHDEVTVVHSVGIALDVADLEIT